MQHMRAESRQPVAFLETAETNLVERDDRQPGQRDFKGVMVEQCHAEQGRTKEDEIDRDTEQCRPFSRLCHRRSQ